ncbi:MAG TPA: organic hydroperoxide resistance protein [Candidatus Dormibacteraeota bacterium]|nr:organic hydroperoxide resistance protein [Candidatus Dormibacteraeota bacterium]
MTSAAVNVLYTAEATATGGRAGHATSSDGRLDVDLSVPKELGGDSGPGTNPEQLFAAGYAACFQGAMGLVARRENVSIDGSTVTARVGLGPVGEVFNIKVELQVHLPSIPDQAAAEDLVAKAHQVCPYSNATRDNVDVTLSVV